MLLYHPSSPPPSLLSLYTSFLLQSIIMASKLLMKRVDESSKTNVYEPFEYREYREGRECDKNFMIATGIRKPFTHAKASSLIHNLPKEIFPRHLQEFHARFYLDQPTLTLNFRMYGFGYAWNLRKFGRVLKVSSRGNLFYTRSTKTEDFMKMENYHPSAFCLEAPIFAFLVQNTILQPYYHCKGVPSEHWNKSQLHYHLMPWAEVLLKNVFVEDEAQEKLPIIVGYMLYCIVTDTPFNFAYFIAKRMEPLHYNDEPLPYARLMTHVFNYIKSKYPSDPSRMSDVDDVTPMEDPFSMNSLEL